MRTLLGRVTGFSTPFFGLSWDREDGEDVHVGGQRADTAPVLTAADCARMLRVRRKVILDLLEKGSIRGFSVGGEWRTTSNAVMDYLAEQSRAKAFETFVSQVEDPKIWAAEFRSHPELMERVQKGAFPEDSFGRFLQDALRGAKGEDSDRA